MRMHGFLAATLVLTACGGGDAGDAGRTPELEASAVEAPAPAAGVTDAQIAAIVVAANSVDVDAGALAAEQATDPEVKAFAQLMVTDHTAVNKQAAALVARLGVTPEANPTSDALRKGGEETRATLEALSGAGFDRAYIDHEVAYHQQVLDALDSTLIPDATNAELRALLVQVRPAFVAHLDHARTLQTRLAQ